MKHKEKGLRMCAGCRQMKRRNDFIRLVKTSNQSVEIDAKKNGRGVYICKTSLICLDNSIKTRKLSRGLGIEVKDDIIDEIRKMINELSIQ